MAGKPFPVPAESVRDAARARLAASDVASLAANKSFDVGGKQMKQALGRILILMPELSADDAREFLGRMISWLREAPLTTNINAGAWFVNDIKSPDFLTSWDLVAMGIFGKGPGYDATREKSELAMFHYSDPAKIAPSANIPSAVIDRIKDTGSTARVNLEKRPAGYENKPDVLLPKNTGMRPKYASLNYAHCTLGGAGGDTYGRSHFVLKHYMRFDATFTYCDSFAFNTRDNVEELCTWHNMQALIVHADDEVVREMGKSMRDPFRRPTQVCDGQHYIEAQLHTDVRFARDVEVFRVSIAEINSGDSEQRKKKEKNLRKFIERNSLEVQFF